MNKSMMVCMPLIMAILIISVMNVETNLPIEEKRIVTEPLEDLSLTHDKEDKLVNKFEELSFDDPVSQETFLNTVNERLSAGEDPYTPLSVMVGYQGAIPELPPSASIRHVFDYISTVEVITNLGSASTLVSVPGVVSVAESKTASYQSPQLNGLAIENSYPLLMNETTELIGVDNTTGSGKGVIVAILSTGINETHPMLWDQDNHSLTEDPKIIASFDAYDEVMEGIIETIDNNGRGTALASLVAGTTETGAQILDTSNSLSYPFPYGGSNVYSNLAPAGLIQFGTQHGIAPEATLYDVKISNDAGTTTNDAAIIYGLEWALKNKADVVLLDAQNTGEVVNTAIEVLAYYGVLVVVPVGDFDNGGYQDDVAPYYSISHPATSPNALTVGTSTEEDEMWFSSSRGPVPYTEQAKPDIVAPGVHSLVANHLFATHEENDDWDGSNSLSFDSQFFTVLSGTTSASAAVVVGAAALLIEQVPGATPNALKIALRQTAKDLGYNQMWQGVGKVQVSAALDLLNQALTNETTSVGRNLFTRELSTNQYTHSDFEDMKILVDGSYSNVGSSETNLNSGTFQYAPEYGNFSNFGHIAPDRGTSLTTMGAGSWQHPYNDTVAGSYWHNVSYNNQEGLIRIALTSVTLGSGDSLRIYSSATPSDPSPTQIYVTATNTSSLVYRTLALGEKHLFFEFVSDGSNDTLGSPIYGMNGYIEFFSSESWQFPFNDTVAGTYWHTEVITGFDLVTLYYGVDLPDEGDFLHIRYSIEPTDDPSTATAIALYVRDDPSETRQVHFPNYIGYLHFGFTSDGDFYGGNENDLMNFGLTNAYFRGTVNRYLNYYKPLSNNLTNTGIGEGWNHPYQDTSAGRDWYNVTYPGVSTMLVITDLIIDEGDAFEIYASDNLDDPSPTLIYRITSNVTGRMIPLTPQIGHTTIFYCFFSDGDGVASSSPQMGVYGEVYITEFARTAKLTEVYTDAFEFDDFLDQLQTLGATVHYWDSVRAGGPPSRKALSFYDMFFLGQPLAAMNYDDYGLDNRSHYYLLLAENTASFIEGGGSIFMVGDHELHEYNYFTNDLGVEWHYGGVGGPTTTFAQNHSALSNVFNLSQVLVRAPYAYLSSVNATTLVWDSTVPTVMVQEVGAGRLVYVADEDIFNDNYWTVNTGPWSPQPQIYNNTQLAMNLVYWVTNVSYMSGSRTNSTEFDLKSYTLHDSVVNNSEWRLDVTLENTGSIPAEPVVALGWDWSYGGDQSIGLELTTDNANDTWGFTPDNDVGVSLNDTTIEFYYNLTLSVNDIYLPRVELSTSGIDESVTNVTVLFNGVPIGTLVERNTTTGGSMVNSFNIYPAPLYQVNNQVEIIVPASQNLTVDSCQLLGGVILDNSPYNLQPIHQTIGEVEPGETTTLSFSLILPNVTSVSYFSPTLLTTVRDLNTASDFGTTNPLVHMLGIGYTYEVQGYYDLSNVPVITVPKLDRNDKALPFLVDVTPSILTSKTAPKLVNFPGDIRVDGLNLMTSRQLDDVSIALTGDIANLVGLGSYQEAVGGNNRLAGYSGYYAPNYFKYNSTWANSTTHEVVEMTETYVGAVLQTYVPTDAEEGTYSGALTIYQNESSVYSVPLELTIQTPKAKLLLIDYSYDTISTSMNYDKLWDSVFEFARIGAEAGYDLDSWYQEQYFDFALNLGSDSAEDWFSKVVASWDPCDENPPYAALVGVGMDSEFSTAEVNQFFSTDGHNIVEFNQDERFIGQSLTDRGLTVMSPTSRLVTVVSPENSSNPLLEGVESLFYLGGGYLDINTDEYPLDWVVTSGKNWFSQNKTTDLLGMFRESVIPEGVGYDKGKYPSVGKTVEGIKIVMGTDVFAQSWFLEQVDRWYYYAASEAQNEGMLTSGPNEMTFDTERLIQNIYMTASNQRPEIEDVELSTRHVRQGEVVTVTVSVTDDLSDPEDLLVVMNEDTAFDSSFYVDLAYDSEKDVFVGVIEVTGNINDWSVYVFDEYFARGSSTQDRQTISGCFDERIIPEMNYRPSVTICSSCSGYVFTGSPGTMAQITVGDIFFIPISYYDAEDGLVVELQVQLYRYNNSVERSLVLTQVYLTYTGEVRFFLDTTGLEEGTYEVVGMVTDTEGGSYSEVLWSFNIGVGTKNIPAPDNSTGGGGGGVDLVMVGGGLATLTIIGGGGATAGYFILQRKGLLGGGGQP